MHARFSPSAMARIIACPGSVALCEQAPPRPESEYAAEGTQAHKRAEELLYDGESTTECSSPEAVDLYVKYADALLDRAGEAYGIEDRVGDGDLFGTSDCWALVDRILHVVDYKHGAGVKVYAEENRQLLTYAGLILAERLKPGQVEGVRLVVAQPRCHEGRPIEEWDTSVARVDDHMAQVHEAMRLAALDPAPLQLGPHCRWCDAKIICPAVTRAEEGVAQWDPRDLSPEELNQALIAAAAVEEKCKALFVYAQERVEAGERLDDWKLVNKQARRRFTDEGAVVELARRMRVYGKLVPHKLLTPAQAAKVLTGPQYARLEQYIEAKSSGVTLRPRSDKAPEVETPMAALAALGKRT